MANLILGLAIVLIFVILLMLFRIQRLVSVAKGEHKEKVDGFNNLNANLMWIFPLIGVIAAIWYSGEAAKNFLPEASSIHGQQTDSLFWFSTAVILLMFVITNAALFYFAFRYRYKKENKASFFPENHKLEIAWTITPAIILTILVFYGNKVWWDIMGEVPKDAEVVEIVGQQFAWKTRYPGKDKKMGNYDYRLIDATNDLGIDFGHKDANDDFVSGKLVLPVNRPILFKIRAKDVLHSVFAPHFRLKMDAVPGMPTQFHFTPTKTTAQMRSELGNPKFNYEIACTEICGKGHYSMRLLVEVVEEAEYKKWYASQSPFLKDNPEYKGRDLKWLRKKKNFASKKQEEKTAHAKID
ncbi:cytochrome c oxidase subunit II [uncultured Microscilla sp.]|uniref:cytochrome c oxidase subunit II n=1 Tax=uncultured Microscilla sp. TaxID=432653 RepID=UPI0026352A01|nr:cytochrome c oxidase subunit II [uncultured Microscilla sp.]